MENSRRDLLFQFIIILSILMIIFSISVLSGLRYIQNSQSSAPNPNTGENDHKLHVNPTPPMATRADSTLEFVFHDPLNDVYSIETVIEDYSSTKGFDIKNITSKLNGNRIWLNMTIYDNIHDDEKIYYKMVIADVEVLYYRGEGEILYKDSSESLVYDSIDTISADIDLNKITFDTFTISGIVYLEDKNSTLGEYKIFDEVGAATGSGGANSTNGLNQHYEDKIGDVKITYVKAGDVSDEPEIDMISMDLEDSQDSLKVTITCAESIGIDNGFLYEIDVGNALFSYSAGVGTITYYQDTTKSIDVEIKDRTLAVTFSMSDLVFPPSTMDVLFTHTRSELRTSKDLLKVSLPKYIYNKGEALDLFISMFDNDRVTMRLQGTLGPATSKDFRARIDQMGDGNGLVIESELARFTENLTKDFTTDDFFEFYPIIDSMPGNGSLEFLFENATGSTLSTSVIHHAVIGSWEFPLITGNKHNITLRFLNEEKLAGIGLNYVFNFNYVNVTFTLQDDIIPWTFNDKSFEPGYISNYFEPQFNQLKFPGSKYYQVNNKLDFQQFSFSISYNKTALDKEKKSDDDGESGFLLGFESYIAIIGVIIALIITLTRKKQWYN